jgi:hypothetical protein
MTPRWDQSSETASLVQPESPEEPRLHHTRQERGLWRPKSNVGVYASVEAIAMNDKSFSATGKGGIRVGF